MRLTFDFIEGEQKYPQDAERNVKHVLRHNNLRKQIIPENLCEKHIARSNKEKS